VHGAFYAATIQIGGRILEKETLEPARQHAREGKAATTQAREFVREEVEHIL